MTRVQILDQTSQNLILELEVTENEIHEATAEVTKHPVEQGAQITDHIRPEPRTLRLHGYISNTPADANAIRAGATYPLGVPGNAEAAFQTLEAARQAGQLCTVNTLLNGYSNMAITSISSPRSAQTGDMLEFTIAFVEVRIIQNLTVTVQTQLPQSQTTKAIGKKVPAPVTPSANDASVLDKIVFGGK